MIVENSVQPPYVHYKARQILSFVQGHVRFHLYISKLNIQNHCHFRTYKLYMLSLDKRCWIFYSNIFPIQVNTIRQVRPHHLAIMLIILYTEYMFTVQQKVSCCITWKQLTKTCSRYWYKTYTI
jgi:hypothetical protein